MGNVHMEATQINYREGNKKMSVAQAIKNAGSEITPEEKEWIDTIPELASQEIIAPEFDAEEGVYAVGDLVIYQGGLYKFTTAHETAGAWNPEEVAAVKVSEELSSLESGLTDLGTRVNGIYTRTFYNDTTSTTMNNVYLPKTDKHTIVIIAGNDICTLSVNQSGIVEQNNINSHITVALNENNQFVVSGCPYYSRPMLIATYDFRQQPT